jgi:predicted  nucleic acid-binding Zn-ribbon protein
MPDLGKKFECYSCGTKFYNLGKAEAVCPKCGANQKEARTEDAPTPAPRPARRAAILEPPPNPDEQTNEFGEEGPAAEEDDEDDELDEEDEAEEKEREEEEEF